MSCSSVALIQELRPRPSFADHSVRGLGVMAEPPDGICGRTCRAIFSNSLSAGISSRIKQTASTSESESSGIYPSPPAGPISPAKSASHHWAPRFVRSQPRQRSTNGDVGSAVRAPSVSSATRRMVPLAGAPTKSRSRTLLRSNPHGLRARNYRRAALLDRSFSFR